jgi:hypothetical protein
MWTRLHTPQTCVFRVRRIGGTSNENMTTFGFYDFNKLTV